MPILNLPTTIDIPFETLTNEQRKAIHTVMTGKGLINPLAEKIQKCRDACLSEIDIINGLDLAVFDGGGGNCPTCTGSECFTLSAQQRQDIVYLLNLLIYWLDVLMEHTDRLSGSEVGGIDMFFQRLSTAGAYTSAMKTITGLNKEKFSMVFHSLMGPGDVCLDRILNNFTGNCVDGYTVCGANIAANSGVVGIANGVCNGGNADQVISCFINSLIECVKDLIEVDDGNYCEAKEIVDKYASSSRLTKDAIADPIIGQIIQSIFATPQLKQALLDIKQSEASDEVLQKTEQFFPEFTGDVDRDTNCEGSPFVIVGPPGPQGVPGIDGCRGPVGPPGAPGVDGQCFDGAPCGGTLGACCVSGFCLEITDSQCAFYNGDYFGDESDCNTAECYTSTCGNDNDCFEGEVCCQGTCTQPCTENTHCSVCPPCNPCPNCVDCGGNCCGDGELCCNGDCMPECDGGGCPNCQGGCCPQGTVCCGADGCCPSDRCCEGGCCPPGEICCLGGCKTVGPCGGCEEGECCDENGNVVDPCSPGGPCPDPANEECGGGCGCPDTAPYCCEGTCYGEPQSPCGEGCCPTGPENKCCDGTCCSGPFGEDLNCCPGNDGCPCGPGEICCDNECKTPCEANQQCPCDGECCEDGCLCSVLGKNCCGGSCCDGDCCGEGNCCEGDFPCCLASGLCDEICTSTGGCPCEEAGCCGENEECCISATGAACCNELVQDLETGFWSGEKCCDGVCTEVCWDGSCPAEGCCGGCPCWFGTECCPESGECCCPVPVDDPDAGACQDEGLGGCCTEECCPPQKKCCPESNPVCTDPCYGQEIIFNPTQVGQIEENNPAVATLACWEEPECGAGGNQGACPEECSGGGSLPHGDSTGTITDSCCSALGGDCCAGIEGPNGQARLCGETSSNGWNPIGTDYENSACCPPGFSCCGAFCTHSHNPNDWLNGCPLCSFPSYGGGIGGVCDIGSAEYDRLHCCVDGQETCGECGCCATNDNVCIQWGGCPPCHTGPCTKAYYVDQGELGTDPNSGDEVFIPCSSDEHSTGDCGECEPMPTDFWVEVWSTTSFESLADCMDNYGIAWQDCMVDALNWTGACCRECDLTTECDGKHCAKTECISNFCGAPVDGECENSTNNGHYCECLPGDICTGALIIGPEPPPGIGPGAQAPPYIKGACCYFEPISDDADSGIRCVEARRDVCSNRLNGFHFSVGEGCCTGLPGDSDCVNCETVPRNMPGGDGGTPPIVSPNNPTNPCLENQEFCVDSEGNGKCCKEGQICCNGECKSGGKANSCCYSEITRKYYHCPHGCCPELGETGDVICKTAVDASNCPQRAGRYSSQILRYPSQRTYTTNNFKNQDIIIQKQFDSEGRLSNYFVTVEDKPVVGGQDELSVQITLTDASTKPETPQIITAPIQFQIINYVADDKIKTDTRPTVGLSSKDTKSKISKAEVRGKGTEVGQPNYQSFGASTTTIKGSVTANILSNGILGESQLITFVSGSNIRLDSNEDSSAIQISVDDFNLWELLDVEDGVSGATSGDMLQFNGTKWGAVAVAQGPTGPTGPIAGSNQQILFNDGTGASGSSNLTYNPTTNSVGITASVTMNSGFTAGGTCYFQDNEVDQIKLKDYSETVYAVGNVNSSTAFNLENGNVQTVTVAGIDIGSTITFSFSNPPASGNAGSITLIMTNPMAHGDVAWHSSVKWSGGTAPSLSSSGTDILSFTTLDAGTTWYGFVGGIGMS